MLTKCDKSLQAVGAAKIKYQTELCSLNDKSVRACRRESQTMKLLLILWNILMPLSSRLANPRCSLGLLAA